MLNYEYYYITWLKVHTSNLKCGLQFFTTPFNFPVHNLHRYHFEENQNYIPTGVKNVLFAKDPPPTLFSRSLDFGVWGDVIFPLLSLSRFGFSLVGI